METKPSDSLGFLIHNAARLMRKRFEQRGSAFGLSAAQWRLLFRLKSGEGVAQARLAEFLEIEPISVSRLLDRMEQSEWIERRPDVQDRRVRMIYPTAKARGAFEAIRAISGDIYEEALAGLSQEQRAILMHALRQIADNLADGESVCEGQQSNDQKVEIR